MATLGAIVWFVGFHGRGLTRERQWPAQPADVRSLVYAPDGKTLFTGGDLIRGWDPDTGQVKLTLSVTGGTEGQLAISPAGDRLARTASHRVDVRTNRYELELWDVSTTTRVASTEVCATVAAFSPDGRTLATAATPDYGVSSTIQLWSVPTLAPIAAFGPRPPVSSLCFSPDGKLLASGEADLELLDVATGASVRTLRAPAPSLCGPAQFSPDGQTLSAVVHAQVGRRSSGACTWDVATGRLTRQITFAHGATDASFSADGRTLAVRLYWFVLNRHDRVEVWDVSTGRRIGAVRDRDRWMSSAAIAPDGSHVAVGFQQPGRGVQAPIGVWRVD